MTYLQFSVDDTLTILRELTEKQPRSLFEIERFAFFKRLHEEYGLVVSFYCFFTHEGFTLADVCEHYKQEFQDNADWLRFGAHSTAGNTSFEQIDGAREYDAILRELIRIAGRESIDYCFRPHFFRIAPDLLKELFAEGKLLGVHCPDTKRKCHPFSEEEEARLSEIGYIRKEGILYVKSQMRMELLEEETFDGFLESLRGKKILSLFTHESFLTDEVILNRILRICEFAKKKGYSWGYPTEMERA